MKKYYLFMMLLFAGTVSFGQSLSEINELMGKSQYKKAKEGIDKFLSDAKNASKSDGWYYKGRVYNSLSKDTGFTPTESMKLKNEAFEAFKKYQQMDAKEVSFVLENHGSYFDLYVGLFDLAAKEFNNKNFASSFEGFKNTLKVEDYIRSKGYENQGFKFSALDTSLILNIAIAAYQAKNEDSAMVYYKKLTDANLVGEQYLSNYQILVEYYLKKNDEANLNAILEKGRTLYPNNDYWVDVELDKVSKSGDKTALIAKYEELMKRYPEKFNYPYNLSVELFNQLYFGDNKPANPEALKARLTEVLKNAIPLDKTGADAKILMTKHLYNDAYDYQDSSKKIKGTKPADIKKRNDFKDLFLKRVGECIPYADAAVEYFTALPTLKPVQKANYKSILDILSQLYATKGDLKKSAEYDKKKADVDKM
ncbi:tetratricopeptide repeat protein [Ferruginibacter sp.]|nr:hypothetical protein [Ferruginibacter sp.]